MVKNIRKYVKTGDHVIDLGCGTGAYINILKKQVGSNEKLICIDNNSSMVLYCKRKFHGKDILIKKLAAENLSRLNQKADIIFTSLTLQFTDTSKSISEIKKCLKPNGKLIFAVPLYRTGINIGLDEESKKFKSEFEKNLENELKKLKFNEKPNLEYPNSREKLFRKLLQRAKFRKLSWNIFSLEKNRLSELLEYYKIPWRSSKILNKPFAVRYKILSEALKKAFRTYPQFSVKRYYLVAVVSKTFKS